jgi:hypothetical protein
MINKKIKLWIFNYNFLNNCKGISTIIATLLIVAITIISTGIIWVTINDMINDKMKISNCVNTFDKVLINDYYTCYDSSSDELKISIEIKDIEIDSVIIIIYEESQSKTFELPSTGYTYVKPYNGNYSDSLTLPSQNSALTYIFNVDSAGMGGVSMIKVSPKIEGYQCEASDTIFNIDSC